jgi:hypothetical protein
MRIVRAHSESKNEVYDERIHQYSGYESTLYMYKSKSWKMEQGRYQIYVLNARGAPASIFLSSSF